MRVAMARCLQPDGRIGARNSKQISSSLLNFSALASSPQKAIRETDRLKPIRHEFSFNRLEFVRDTLADHLPRTLRVRPAQVTDGFSISIRGERFGTASERLCITENKRAIAIPCEFK
jgi:hypothetical protein